MDVALEKSPQAEIPKVQSVGFDVNLSGKRTEWKFAGVGRLCLSVDFLFRSSWQQLFRLFLGGKNHVGKSGSNALPHRM